MIRTSTGLICIALLTSCTGTGGSRIGETNGVDYVPPPAPPTLVVSPPEPPPPPPVAVEMPAPTDATGGIQLNSTYGNTVAGNISATRPGTGMQVNVPRTVLGVRGTTFTVQVDDPDGQSATGAPAPRSARQTPRGWTGGPPPQLADTPPPVAADPCAPGEPPSLNLPRYEPWPPEQPSSRIEIDNLIGARGDLTLYDTGQLLRQALEEAGYQQHAFYAVPGGYVILTETERMDPEGVSVTDITRYQRPGDDRKGLFVSIRDLFLERPETYYRYLAIVVSDRQFCLTRETLDIDEAAQRVLGGFTDLSDDTRTIEFSDSFRVTALIYEFKNDGIGYDLSMIAPGRIPPREHLERSGLADALPRIFARASDQARLGGE